MDAPGDAVALVLPPDLLADVESVAAEDNRPAADVLIDLVWHGLEARRWQVHSAGEFQRARELGLTDDDQPMTEEYRQTIRKKIAEGLASARQGKFVDGDTVFARINAELAELDQHEQE
jgi:hypothetical protein